jgi:membrane-associated protease RseP (regulator of RpoE activity)
MMGVAIALGIVALVDLLLVAHECGHYLVARWCGIRVERFRIGFGPVVFERTSRATGTAFLLSLIPLGAFVTIRVAFAAGWVRGLQLVMLFGVYLGLILLLPVPMLDGGRLIALGVRTARRRRADRLGT